MDPNCDTLSNVPCSGYITAHDQSMVESGMTEGGKTAPVFFFVNEQKKQTWKTQAKKVLKATIFKIIPEEKQQLVEKKRCR